MHRFGFPPTVLALPAAGCMAHPTTVGLRSSGELLDPSQQSEVGVHGGVLRIGDVSFEPGATVVPWGADAVLGVVPGRVDLALSGTHGPIASIRGLERGTTYASPWNARAEARIQLREVGRFLDAHDGWMTVVAGAGRTRQAATWYVRGATQPIDSSITYLGPHVGFIVGAPLAGGPVLYGGQTLNPVFTEYGWDDVWISGTAGLRTSSEHPMRFGAEVTGMASWDDGRGVQASAYLTRSFDRPSP